MKETRTLLQIDCDGQSSSIKFKTDGEEDMFALALAITQIFKKSPALFLEFMKISMVLADDENARNIVENSTIDVHNFNDLLKS